MVQGQTFTKRLTALPTDAMSARSCVKLWYWCEWRNLDLFLGRLWSWCLANYPTSPRLLYFRKNNGKGIFKDIHYGSKSRNLNIRNGYGRYMGPNFDNALKLMTLYCWENGWASEPSKRGGKYRLRALRQNIHGLMIQKVGWNTIEQVIMKLWARTWLRYGYNITLKLRLKKLRQLKTSIASQFWYLYTKIW